MVGELLPDSLYPAMRMLPYGNRHASGVQDLDRGALPLADNFAAGLSQPARSPGFFLLSTPAFLHCSHRPYAMDTGRWRLYALARLLEEESFVTQMLVCGYRIEWLIGV